MPNTEYVSVDKSIISTDAILDRVIHAYTLKKPVSCELFQTSLNDVYVVNDQNKTYYLRISGHNWRRTQDVKNEIHLIDYLLKQNLPVVQPVADDRGNVIQTISAPEGLRLAVLFHGAPGIPHDIREFEQCRLFGSIVGKMHRLMDEIPITQSRNHWDIEYMIDKPVQLICSYLDHRKKDQALFKGIQSEGKYRLGKLSKELPEYGLCHGDLHANNIYFTSENTPTLFDFDCAGYGWRVADVAVYVFSMLTSASFQSTTVNWMESFNHFLAGYNEENRLSDKELDNLHLFVLIRQIWSMWLSLSYAHLKGSSFIHDGYFNANIALIKNFIKNFKIF